MNPIAIVLGVILMIMGALQIFAPAKFTFLYRRRNPNSTEDDLAKNARIGGIVMAVVGAIVFII